MENIQVKYKSKYDHHHVDHHFQVGDQVWIHIGKDRLICEGKKPKILRYGSFTILDKVRNNVFQIDFPPYKNMYYVVNVDNWKLYEPLMIMDQEENVHVPSVGGFSPEYLDEF